MRLVRESRTVLEPYGTSNVANPNADPYTIMQRSLVASLTTRSRRQHSRFDARTSTARLAGRDQPETRCTVDWFVPGTARTVIVPRAPACALVPPGSAPVKRGPL